MKFFKQETEALLPSDRCDACHTARAFALAQVFGATLLFCGHHFRKHLPVLREVASVIADETHRIDVNRLPQA